MKKYLFGGAVVLVVVVAAYFWLRPNNTPVVSLPSKTYVALGDSVAAGVGLKYDTDSSACDRTNQSYPAVVAAKQHFKLQLLACSGATIPNGILGKQAVNELLVTPQMEQLFALPKPDLISITIGANDAGWADVIRECYTGGCGTPADTARIDAKLDSLTTNLNNMLMRLQDHYNFTKPRVVVTDYYQVYPAAKPNACASLVGIGDDELTWLRDQRTKINATIKQSLAGYPFAIYADADFTGHELCSDDPWVQGLTASRPYHPTAAGQAAIAEHVIKAYNQATNR